MIFLKTAAILVLPCFLQYLLGISSNYTYGLFISAVLLWFLEIIPLAVTGLIIPTMAVVLGLIDADTAFSAFGNQIIFLFIGSFILAKAFSHHGLDKRIAYFILSQKFATKSLGSLQFFISFICWLLSMWISNTAATALMAPLCLGMANGLKESMESKEDFKNFKKSLLFLTAFGSSIGGMAAPVGSPPNVLAMGFLSQHNIHLSFFDWMLLGLPISFFMLIGLNIMIRKLLPTNQTQIQGLKEYAAIKKKEQGPITRAEIQVMSCFFMALILWISPGLFKLFESTEFLAKFMSTHFPMGVVALISSVTLFFLPGPNMKWEMAKDIDWGTILLFGGGLSLGIILNHTGTAKVVGELFFSNIKGHFLLITFMAMFFGLLMSEFSSNTASASIIIPLILGGLGGLAPGHITSVVVACAFGASFGFMLPVSTPPNAIIYGTGELRLKEMVRTGIFFDLLGMVLIFIFVGLIYPLFK